MSYCKRNRTRRSDFDYTWRKPISASGKQTVYLKVLLYLKAFGPSTKREILGTIKHMNTNFESWRGYESKMFSCMHFDHLIEYNPHSYRWSLGEFGEKLIDIAIGEQLPPIQIENIDDSYKTLTEMRVEKLRQPVVIGAPKHEPVIQHITPLKGIHVVSMPKDERLSVDLHPVKPIGRSQTLEEAINQTGFDVDDFLMDIEEFITKLQMYKRQLKKLK